MLKAKQYKKILKKIKRIGSELPPMEDILFTVLVTFSLTFGLLLFGIGEKIKKENNAVVSVRFPNRLEREIRRMVSSRPISSMAPYISRQDREVAAYLVAIAKKESNWGTFSPKKEGKECYNYWGYRGTYNETESGYSCFDSPGQAVNVVGRRIAELIDQRMDTPRKMIVWKCGQNCSGHDPEAVDKWIRDVDWYYRKF